MTEGFYYGHKTLVKTCGINDFLENQDETDETLSKYQQILSEFEKDSIIHIDENEEEEIQIVAEELNKLKSEFSLRSRSADKTNEEYVGDEVPLE